MRWYCGWCYGILDVIVRMGGRVCVAVVGSKKIESRAKDKCIVCSLMVGSKRFEMCLR